MNNIPTDVYLDLPTHRAHLIDWGGPVNAPTVLLIHGAASNVKMWNLIAPKLAQNFRVIALDQRSHGLSGVPTDSEFGFAAVCDDMQQVCAQLGVERSIVIGHSWGGNVALEYAARHSSSVAGVVMIDGGFSGLNKVVTWPQCKTMIAPPRWLGTPLVAYLERAKQIWGTHYNAEVLNELMGNIEVRSDQTIAPHLTYDNQIRVQRATWEQDAALYSRVKCPALFLPCLPTAPHDPQTKQVVAWKRSMVMPQIQTAMPQAQIEWLTNSLHDVPLQHPELIAENIRAFVAAI